MLLSTVILAVVIYYVYKYITYRNRFKSIDHIPGPRNLPIFGIALEFGFTSVDKLKNLVRISKEYGPLVKGWIGPSALYCLVADPEFTEHILSSPKYIRKSRDYQLFQPWLLNGLLISTGSYWQKRRKMITATFHFKILEDFISVFNTNGEVLIEKLQKKAGNEVFDIYPYITSYTLDVICESAMGTTVNAQEQPDNEYVRAVKDICNVILVRGFSAWKNVDFLFPLSKEYQIQTKALKVIHGFTNSVIEKRRKALESKTDTNENSETNELGIKKKIAFLDLLLKAEIDGKPLSNDDIREEVDTFMFEVYFDQDAVITRQGHDTTASAIAFTLYELARHPQIQEKVLAEAEDIFGDDKYKQPTLQDLNNMKYLELVLKESLRLYPSVPFYLRMLEEDVVFNGTVFPKDLNILFLIYQMQRDPKLFKNPNTFDPDRFINENSQIKNPFSYVPFSAGPRNCIGQKFAMYELKAVISKIIRHYELLPADPKYDIILSSEIILKSDNGVNLRLKKR